MAKKKKLFRTTGGAGYVPPSPDVEALVKNILANDPERTKDILYRIISLGNSAEGTKYDRNAYDILRGIYDSFTDKPMDEDRYTGSWTWTEDGIKSNPERDWNLLFAKGNIKGLYEEIPKNELRGINLSNKYTSYYGNFVPKSHYDITDNYGPLLQYLANHNLGGLALEENGLGVVALPLSELEYQQAVRDKYTVDNVGRFNVSIGKDPKGNPEVLFFDFGNFGREYGDTYGGDDAGLLGELLDTYGNPFILRLYVPINTLSKDQFNALPEDDKWNVEDMNNALLNIANANKVPVMLHDLDTDTYETVFLPEVEKVANKRAEGGALRPEWNSLSMRERAAYIRDAVSRGLNTVTDIRNDYNEFKEGGKKKTNNGSVLTFLNLLNESLKGNSRYNTTGWRKYLTDLAKMESSYRGDVTNSIGAKGYFLLMPSNRSASWSTPTQLFHEMYKLSDANMDYFRKNMTERDLKLAEQMGIDIYGLMAGAHLGGPKNALAALRGGRNNKDKNGTSVLNYMTKFSQTTPRQPVSGDFKTVYFQPPMEETPEIEVPNPLVRYRLISLEDIDNLPLPSRIGDDEIAFEGTAPETIITPEPQKLYIQYTPKEIFDQMSNMITPYEPVELPKPLTATERLKEISDNRVSLLLKDLEDSIIRSYRLNDFDKEKLRRDVEDLLFYRNMAAYGGGIGDDDLVQKNSTISVAGLPYVSTEVEISPEASLRRANKVYSNYDLAVDAPLSWGLKTARNTLRWLKDNVNENIPSGVSNCTLSATLWVDPTNPIKNASSIVNEPNRYNYEPIEAGQAQVGDVLITRNPNDGSYHTMLISGYSNDGGVYDFDGTLMKYGKNEPLLTYSRGGHDASFIRRNIPLSVYLLNSDGKTELHFYRYNKPSRVLKVILKARKKAYGGNLFDGTTQPTQQMNNGLNLYRRTNNLGETEYVYQETPDSEEILLTPTNKRFSDDPTNWDYEDASGRKYSPRMVSPTSPSTLEASEKMGPLEKYVAELNWRAKNDPASIALQGKYTMPAIAAAPFLTLAGEAAYPYVSTALANPYVDTGLTSAFAGHGLNHAINEGIDSWGDAAMTALELAPLGRLARPMFKEAALSVENYRYPFGRPQVPEGYITVKPQVRTRVGDVEIDDPNLLYHLDRGNGVGAFSNRGAYVEDGMLLPGIAKEGEIPYSWWNKGKPYSTSVEGQPMTRLMTTTEDTPGMLHVRSQTYPIGQWNGKRGFVTNAEYVNPEGVNVSESTYTLNPNYGWRRLFAEDASTAKWTDVIRTPQITAENAAGDAALGAADFSYKSQNGLDLLTKHLYERKIHGYPSSYTDAMEFVNGEFVPVEKKWADDVSIGLPKYAQDAIMHDVVDRNIAEFMREGLSAEEAAEYANAAKKQLSNVRSGVYSQRDYNKAGWGDFGGFYDPERNFISINEAGNPKRVYTHEGRHLLDHKIDDEILFPGESTTFGTDFDSDISNAIMQRTRLKQEMMLRDAYDSDFESIPSSKYAEGLENYNYMNREAITTNLDSRTYAYDNFADVNSLNSGTKIEELPTEAQNSFIDGLTDELVFEAVEHANGYGRRYINRLRDEGKLTSKKAQQFREAMKHVGVAAVPVAAGAGLLFGQNNL